MCRIVDLVGDLGISGSFSPSESEVRGRRERRCYWDRRTVCIYSLMVSRHLKVYLSLIKDRQRSGSQKVGK